MRISWRGVVAILIVAVVAGCCSRWWRRMRGNKAGDCVYVHKAKSGEQWRLVFDGERPDGTPIDDEKLIGNGSPRHVGRVHAWSTSNLVAAFQRRRPPKIIMDAGWTTGNDDVEVKFNPEIEIDVVVWIVDEPYDDVELAALDAIKTAVDIFRMERMGVRFGDVRFATEVKGNPNRSTYRDFKCSLGGDMRKSQSQGGIGFESDKINIYFVRSVYSDDSSTGTGVNPEAAYNIYAGTHCGRNDFVVVSSAAGDTLLAHELGHCLWMDHTNGMSEFDSTNVMWDSGNSRQYLAEGQLFRAHLLDDSAINGLYHARPGEPTVPFVGSTGINMMSSQKKLARNKRLFADGSFPPN